MSVITVPGANSTIVSNTFNGTSNTTLAQSIATTLNALLAAGTLTTSSVGGGGTAPAPPSPPNSLEITSGGVVAVPAGYGAVVDGSGNANLTVTGGNSFFGGSGNINYTNSGAVPALISAGDGNDVFNLSGSYTVAAGTGSDTYNLSGTGIASLGGGSSTIQIASGADTIFAGSPPGNIGMTGGAGSVDFVASNSVTVVTDYIVGGTGGTTIAGAANNVVVYAGPTAGGATAAGVSMVGGAGNELLYDASPTNDILFAGNMGGNQILRAGSGNDTLVGGSGNDSLIGGTGNDTFDITSKYLASVIGHTSITAGNDFLFNTQPGESLNLSGFDTLYGGAPGSNTAAAAIEAQIKSTPAGQAITLNDGTKITFATGANGINLFSN